MNPIRIHPPSLVAIHPDGSPPRLARVYSLRDGGALVEVYNGHGWQRYEETKGGNRVGRIFEPRELSPVASVPEAAAELRGLAQAGRPCPFAGRELRAAAVKAGAIWTINGYRESARLDGVDDPPTPEPDTNDLHAAGLATLARGPFLPFPDELRGFRRIFRRTFEQLAATGGA